jgi:FlaG/FlaF family flagellin (archaellin)
MAYEPTSAKTHRFAELVVEEGERTMSIIKITGSGAYEYSQENNHSLEYLRRNLTKHKEKSPLDHPDGSVTEEKLSPGLLQRIKGHEINIQELNDVKADKTDTYTQSEVNTALNNLELKIDDLETNANEISVRINSKSDKAQTYTKAETDEKLDTKADKATTLEGYGITDAYTKTEIDTQIGDIEAALDNIIMLQNSCIGGDSE